MSELFFTNYGFYGLHMFLMLDGNFVATPWILQVCALELKQFVLPLVAAFLLRVKNKVFNKYLFMHRKNIFATIFI